MIKLKPFFDSVSFSGKRVRNFDGSKRYLSTGDLQNDRINFESVTFEGRPSRANILVDEGDILFARMKDTKKVLQISEPYNDVIVSTGFSVVKPKPNVSGSYISFYLRSKEFEYQKSKYCTGAVQPAITNSGMKKLYIPLPYKDGEPNFSYQIQVASILSQIDKLISVRQKSINKLDACLNGIYLDFFGPKNKHFNSWPLVEIKDLASAGKGSMRTGPFGSNLKHDEFTESGEVAVLGIDNAVKNSFKWDKRRYVTLSKYESLKTYTIYPEDVIVTIMGTVGRSAVIPKDIPLAINTKHLAAITFDKRKANPYFMSYSIHSSPYIINQFKSKTRGAIMDGLNLGIIKKTKLKRPPIELQNKFSVIFHKVELLKERYKESLKELENLYGALSQKAFKGELDLSKIELPEQESLSPQSELVKAENRASATVDLPEDIKAEHNAPLEVEPSLVTHPRDADTTFNAIPHKDGKFLSPDEDNNVGNPIEGLPKALSEFSKQFIQKIQSLAKGSHIDLDELNQLVDVSVMSYSLEQNMNLEDIIDGLEQDEIDQINSQHSIRFYLHLRRLIYIGLRKGCIANKLLPDNSKIVLERL